MDGAFHNFSALFGNESGEIPGHYLLIDAPFDDPFHDFFLALHGAQNGETPAVIETLIDDFFSSYDSSYVIWNLQLLLLLVCG